MHITGVTSLLGTPVIEFDIAHGSHPDITLWENGFITIRPLSATRIDGEVNVVLLVRNTNKSDRPQRHRLNLVEASPSPDEKPVINQRIAAYALVTSDRGLLGTVGSSRTNAPGLWMLPGGGLNDNETPSAAVIREIHEETGQSVQLDRLLTIQSDHWIGRAPNGILEDFHALRIIYAASCPNPTKPIVYDREGTTQHAAWIPRSKWRKFPWTAGARVLLGQHICHS